MLPMQSVEEAISEMRFAARELGFRTDFVRPNPYNGRALHDPDNYPLWGRRRTSISQVLLQNLRFASTLAA
jgi:hypothetical protein